MDNVKIIKINKFLDKRGYFFEIFNKKKFSNLHFKQFNLSCSKKNVLRGLHYQTKKPQDKLLSVIKGEIFDVAIDLRNNSKNFGKVFTNKISEKDKKQLWIPKGFAHGFLGLAKENIVIYGVTDYFLPKYEETILWNDKRLNIKWPVKKNLRISKKDKSGYFFDSKKKYFTS